MPKFMVKSRPFWDGVHMHAPGTVLEIDREDYEKLLCLNFVGVDAQAREDLKEAKANLKDDAGNPIKFNPLYLEVSGTLDPNKPKDLEKLTPRGARVISTPTPKPGEPGGEPAVPAVVPETARLPKGGEDFDPFNAPPSEPKVTRAHRKRRRAV